MIVDRIQLNEDSERERLLKEGKTEVEIINHFLSLYVSMLKALKKSDKINYDDLTEMDLHFINRIQAWKSRKESLQRQLEIENKLDQFIENPDSFEHTTIADKMIYLNELGIFEYLQNRFKTGGSNNAIARILSKIIEEKQVSIQPVIKPITTNSNCIKNPYNAKKNNAKYIRELLTKEGFKIK